MRSSSVAPRRAADHALIRSTKCAQHLERNMPVLMPLARATRWPIYNRDLRPGQPTRPPQPARTIKGPDAIAFELLEEDADQRGALEGVEETCELRGCPASCRCGLAQRGQDGCHFLAEDEAQLEAPATRRSP